MLTARGGFHSASRSYRKFGKFITTLMILSRKTASLRLLRPIRAIVILLNIFCILADSMKTIFIFFFSPSSIFIYFFFLHIFHSSRAAVLGKTTCRRGLVKIYNKKFPSFIISSCDRPLGADRRVCFFTLYFGRGYRCDGRRVMASNFSRRLRLTRHNISRNQFFFFFKYF